MTLGPNSIQYQSSMNPRSNTSKIKILKDGGTKLSVLVAHAQATYVTALTYLSLTIYPRDTLEEDRLDDLLVPLPLEDAPEFLEVPEHQVYQMLCKLDSNKACGPNEIPNVH